MALTRLETDAIEDDAITTAKIATGAVTSSDILDGTVAPADVTADVLDAGVAYAIVFG
jgi:hypothetical protein